MLCLEYRLKQYFVAYIVFSIMKPEFIHSLKLFNFYVGFGILMFVTVKDLVLWVVTLCSPEKAQGTGGTYDLHLQGQRVSQTRNEWK